MSIFAEFVFVASLLHTATPQIQIDRPVVPARGDQQSLISVDTASMVHIQTHNRQGTSCELIDHQLGRIAQSGQLGKTNCNIDILLDRGQYLLRMHSRKKGRGQVKVTAKPFTALDDQPRRMPVGSSEERMLKPQQSISYWIHLDKARFERLNVYGRTAGLATLWRNGRWLEDIQADDQSFSPRAGQPIYHWQIARTLEAGDYLFTVYGRDAKTWSKGALDNRIFVSRGVQAAQAGTLQKVRIPAWGEQELLLPNMPAIASMYLDSQAKSRTALSIQAVKKASLESSSSPSSCQLDKESSLASCTVSDGEKFGHILSLSGPPGTDVLLRWARLDRQPLEDGEYASSPNRSVKFRVPQSGLQQVSADLLPLNPDRGPLSCRLMQKISQYAGKIIAYDFVQVGDDKPFLQRFNYRGTSTEIWFEATDSATYKILSSGEAAKNCELFRINPEGNDHRLSESAPKDKKCSLELDLKPGYYRLKLYNGLRGVEQLQIVTKAGTFAKIKKKLGFGKAENKAQQSPQKLSCRFKAMHLSRRESYYVEWASNQSGPAAVGIHLRSPSLDTRKTTILTLNGQEKLDLRVDQANPLVIDYSQPSGLQVAVDGAAMRALPSGGRIQVSASGRLQLTNLQAQALQIFIHPPQKTLPKIKPSPYAPSFAPITRLSVDTKHFADFERKESHSLIFAVRKAGMYKVTSLGLLDTACSLRTAVHPDMTSDNGSGRGRNCQILTMLNPGEYLLSIKTKGQSRGRGGVLLTRKNAEPKPAVILNHEVFFQADASSLVQQKIHIKKAGDYHLTSTSQGPNLRCRLEDAQGWPLDRVPSRCDMHVALKKGDYLWTQLPVDVESMRRTLLLRDSSGQRVLRGNKRSHTIALNKRYSAELGRDGEDVIKWSLSAHMGVNIELDRDMQARVQRRVQGHAGQQWKNVALVAANENEQDPALQDLPAGRYRMLTRHSRGDVGIRYHITLRSHFLSPGMHIEFNAPTKLHLRLDKQAVARIKTTGQSDLRCRLLDANGQVLQRSSHVGDDWNCAIVRPLEAGDYLLEIEREGQAADSSVLWFSSPKEQQIASLDDDKAFQLKKYSWFGKIPKEQNAEDTIDLLSIRGDQNFSCALQGADGQIYDLQQDTKRCQILAHMKGSGNGLRLWTRGQDSKVQILHKRLPVEKMHAHSLAKNHAGLMHIDDNGLYATAATAWCIPAKEQGRLKRCGPNKSLFKGDWIFAHFNQRKVLRLSLREQVLKLDKTPRETSLRISQEPSLQRQSHDDKAIHLLALRTIRGEQAMPSCKFAKGLVYTDAEHCFSVSDVKDSALAQWWSADQKSHKAKLWRAALPYDGHKEKIRLGETDLRWKAPLGRFVMPSSSFDLNLVLAAQSWAILVGPDLKTRDFCLPQDKIHSCQLSGASGRLFVYAPTEQKMHSRLVLRSGEQKRVLLQTLVEAWPKRDGEILLQVPATTTGRQLLAESASAGLRCQIRLQDGRRQNSCTIWLPKNMSADMLLHYPAGPWRALASEKQNAKSLDMTRWRWGLLKKNPRASEPAKSSELSDFSSNFSVSLKHETLLKIHADNGICALFAKKKIYAFAGMGRGCRIERFVPAGEYQLQVRGFARQKLRGQVTWTQSFVPGLKEGVGPETWIAPNSSAYFVFKMASKGQVGLGLQTDSDRLNCRILNMQHALMGEGCQQLTQLEAGRYLLEVSAPDDGRAQSFKAVVLGLEGGDRGVPREYLKSFFENLGGES